MPEPPKTPTLADAVCAEMAKLRHRLVRGSLVTDREDLSALGDIIARVRALVEAREKENEATVAHFVGQNKALWAERNAAFEDAAKAKAELSSERERMAREMEKLKACETSDSAQEDLCEVHDRAIDACVAIVRGEKP